jgi:hypothetical protein
LHATLCIIILKCSVLLKFYRLALTAFTKQKKRFFPGLAATTTSVIGAKRPRSEGSESSETAGPSLPDLLKRIQSETQGMAVTPYERLAWLNKSNSTGGMSTIFASRVITSNSSLSVRYGNVGTVQPPSQAGGDNPTSSTRQNEKLAVLEASIPGVLLAVISVLPAGSVYPDAVAVFSPAEVGHDDLRCYVQACWFLNSISMYIKSKLSLILWLIHLFLTSYKPHWASSSSDSFIAS